MLIVGAEITAPVLTEVNSVEVNPDFGATVTSNCWHLGEDGENWDHTVSYACCDHTDTVGTPDAARRAAESHQVLHHSS